MTGGLIGISAYRLVGGRAMACVACVASDLIRLSVYRRICLFMTGGVACVTGGQRLTCLSTYRLVET